MPVTNHTSVFHNFDKSLYKLEPPSYLSSISFIIFPHTAGSTMDLETVRDTEVQISQ